MKFKKIFITGGAGYVGSCLVPELLKKGYDITVYDIMYFSDNFLPKNNPKLKIIRGDIRDKDKLYNSCKNNEVFLNLACISNDTSFALDEKLSTSINLDAFEPMVIAAKNAGIKRFIYASTSSVYGISTEKNVTEDHPLVPLTLYNKYKGICEPLLFKHTDNNFEGVIFRPATVCGYAPRQRLDLSVNILTNFAVNKNKINLTNILSRPVKKNKWQYSFFLEFSGHASDKNVLKLFKELQEVSYDLKVLGSYPAAY